MERNVELESTYPFIRWANVDPERDLDLPKVIQSNQSFIYIRRGRRLGMWEEQLMQGPGAELAQESRQEMSGTQAN